MTNVKSLTIRLRFTLYSRNSMTSAEQCAAQITALPLLSNSIKPTVFHTAVCRTQQKNIFTFSTKNDDHTKKKNDCLAFNYLEKKNTRQQTNIGAHTLGHGWHRVFLSLSPMLPRSFRHTLHSAGEQSHCQRRAQRATGHFHRWDETQVHK